MRFDLPINNGHALSAEPIATPLRTSILWMQLPRAAEEEKGSLFGLFVGPASLRSGMPGFCLAVRLCLVLRH